MGRDATPGYPADEAEGDVFDKCEGIRKANRDERLEIDVVCRVSVCHMGVIEPVVDERGDVSWRILRASADWPE